jgi:hypothetical protein
MIHVLQVPKIIEDKLSKVKDLIIQYQNEGINNARDRYKIKDLYYKEDALEKELIASKEYFRKREAIQSNSARN